MLLGLSKGLQNLTKGEKRKISLRAEEAYGFYDPNKIILYPRKRLPLTIKVGDTVSILEKSGTLNSYAVVVVVGFSAHGAGLTGNVVQPIFVAVVVPLFADSLRPKRPVQ